MTERHWKYRSLYWDFDKSQWEWLVKKETKKGYCPVRGCTRAVSLTWGTNNGKPKLYARTYCERCAKRRYRTNYPVRSMWHELNSSAHRRKLEISITYGEFLLFCHDNDFYYRSPKFTASTLTIDRIDPTRGYHVDNIQLVTQSVNAKRNRAHQMNQPDPLENNDDPF